MKGDKHIYTDNVKNCDFPNTDNYFFIIKSIFLQPKKTKIYSKRLIKYRYGYQKI